MCFLKGLLPKGGLVWQPGTAGTLPGRPVVVARLVAHSAVHRHRVESGRDPDARVSAASYNRGVDSAYVRPTTSCVGCLAFSQRAMISRAESHERHPDLALHAHHFLGNLPCHRTCVVHLFFASIPDLRNADATSISLPGLDLITTVMHINCLKGEIGERSPQCSDPRRKYPCATAKAPVSFSSHRVCAARVLGAQECSPESLIESVAPRSAGKGQPGLAAARLWQAADGFLCNRAETADEPTRETRD